MGVERRGASRGSRGQSHTVPQGDAIRVVQRHKESALYGQSHIVTQTYRVAGS